MKLGRIWRESPDGPVARIVSVHLDEERVVDLAAAEASRLRKLGAGEAAARRVAAALFPASMSAAISLGDAFPAAAAKADGEAGDEGAIAFADVRWAAPLDPPMIRDSLTFPAHMEQLGSRLGISPPPEFFNTPGFFKGSTATVYGPDEEIPYPSCGEEIDHELEFGIVVGREGRNLTPEQAERCLFGFTIFNDFSIRDIQMREASMKMGPQKAKDFAYGIGPWIVTADELPPVTELATSVSVNGEHWGDGISDGMVWTPAQLLAYVSIADGLQPGDIVGTGTVGNGSGAEFGRSLKPGDTVELHVEGIGTLRNRLSTTVEEYPWWPEPQPNPFEEKEEVKS